MFRDGPLRRRAPEEIRFGTGKSALGLLLVACSARGVVTIMVRDKPAQLLREFRERFPRAELVHDEQGCAPTVAKVVGYIARPSALFKLPLDIRGTAFQQRVWREVRRIPRGQTSSYTKVAEAIGAPKAVRAVASSCTRCWLAFAIPCHRVLHSGPAKAARKGRRFRWLAYEAKLLAKQGKG